MRDGAWLHSVTREGYACLSREVLERAAVRPESAADVAAALNALAERFFDAKQHRPRTVSGVSHTRSGAVVLLWRACPGIAPDVAFVATLVEMVAVGRPAPCLTAAIASSGDPSAAAAAVRSPSPSPDQRGTPAPPFAFDYTAADVAADLSRVRESLPRAARHLLPDPATAPPRFAATIDAERWSQRQRDISNDRGDGVWLTMSQIRDLLPWPAEAVSMRDHAIVVLLAQLLAGWKVGWKRLAVGADGRRAVRSKAPNQYHIDACAWFARAAELVAHVRARGGDEGAADRLAELSDVLRGGSGHPTRH